MSALQLEAFNGVWTILAAYCIVFLALHLRAVDSRKRLSWRSTPAGAQLAIATLALCVGILLSRGAVWFWRFALGGDYTVFGRINIPLAVGAFIGSWAFVCILRVVSRPFGTWPIMFAVGTVALYLATFWRHISAWLASFV